MRKFAAGLLVGLLPLLATGCGTQAAQPAAPPDAPSPSAVDDETARYLEMGTLALNRLQTGDPDVALSEQSGSAVLGVMTYGDYVSEFESDVEVADPALAANDTVLVVGYDGTVDNGSLKWNDVAGPIPETKGGVVAMDTDGRTFSRYVFFVKADEPSAGEVSLVERVTSAAERVVPLG